jgi:hypothetical protein
MWVRRQGAPAVDFQVHATDYAQRLLIVAAAEVTPDAARLFEVYNPATKAFEPIEG